jgi:hypothetical protein
MPKLDKSEIRKGMFLTGDGNLSDCPGFFGKLRPAERVMPLRKSKQELEEEQEAFVKAHSAAIAELARRLKSVRTRIDAVKAKRK